MAALPKGITQADLARYARITDGISKLTEEKNALSEKIKTAYTTAGVSGKKTFVYPTASGALIVELGEQNVLDTKDFAIAYPADKHPLFYKQAVDTKAITPAYGDPFRTKKMTLSVNKEHQ